MDTRNTGSDAITHTWAVGVIMLAWRIYYTNGTTYDSDQGDAGDAPAGTVLAIVQTDEELGRMVLHGWDYYYWHRDEFYGCDIGGIFTHFVLHTGWTRFFSGETVPTPIFRATLERATNDPDFAIKSATQKRREVR